MPAWLSTRAIEHVDVSIEGLALACIRLSHRYQTLVDPPVDRYAFAQGT